MFLRLLTLAACATCLIAQDYRAKVQGIVTDSSDASIAGAKVTLTNNGTGIAAVRETGANGAYLFDNVEPGTYSVSTEFQGFSRQVQEKVLVQTRQDVTVNFSLKPGNMVETVTVSADAVALQFNTSTRELTVDRKMLMDLPVKARNPFTLALLDPAVVNRYGSERNPFFMWSSSQMDVGGNTSLKNDLLIDGAPTQIGPKGSYAPPMDAVQEFSVQQNSVDAEFGHSAGGILSVGMKSGTNDVHGTAYYFGRNPALNAMVNRVTRTPNFIRNHIWGGTVGAPILKNKLFTFMAYEHWRTKEPRDTLRRMPTDLERTGDFSRSLNVSRGLRTIYDPLTTVLDVATNTASRQPFAGNIIPAARIDPTSKRIMQDIWGPNGPGDDVVGSNNFKKSYAWPMKNLNLSNRTDWNINDKWKVFGRYSRFKTTLDQEDYTPNNSAAMTNDNGGIMNSRNIAGDAVWTASPTTVFNFRASFASLEDDYHAPSAAVGEEGLAEFWPNNPWYKPYLQEIPLIYYPRINIDGTGATFGRGRYWIQHPRHYAFSAKMSKSQGAHYWKVGAEHRYHVADVVWPDLMNLNFYPAETANTYLSPQTAVSGDAWASFLLGVLDQRSNANVISAQSVRIPFVAFYVHNDWKIHRRVTLNLGLRYEWESGPFDAEDRYSRFVDLTQPIPEMQANPPAIPADLVALSRPTFNGAWVFSDSENRKQFNTQNNIFLPRAGVAVRVNDKTSLNVGFARYVVPISTIGRSLDPIVFPGFNATSNPLTQAQGVPRAFLSNPFPAGENPLQPAPGKAFGRHTNLGNAATWTNQDYKAQINDRFNFTLMREIPGQFKVDATYFLNYGRYQPRNYRPNMADPNLSYTYKADLSRNIPNPFFRYGTPETFPGALRNQATVTRGSLLRPYPQYGELTVDNTGDFRGRYQALQLRAQRSYTAGASVLFAYNYNQERNEAFFNDIQEYANEVFWQPSNNARHRMTVAGTYDFPLGKGRQFLNALHPIVNGVLGGWQVSGIYTYRSGEQLRFTNAMQVVGDPVLDNPTPNAWFNKDAFRPNPAFTPRTNPYAFDGLTGPRVWNIDATISKSFPISERFNLEFRGEAYNLTNSIMWANPNLDVNNSLFGRTTAPVNQNRGRELQYTLRLHF